MPSLTRLPLPARWAVADDPLAAELAAIAERVSASGAGGWWTDPNDGDADEVTIWDGEGTPVAVARTASAPGDAIAAFITAARSGVPRLLKAVEAVLEKHVRKPSIRLIPCSEHERWRGPLVGDNDNLAVRRACPECQVLDDSWCLQCVKSDGSGTYAAWPCPTVAAITRELTGGAE